MKYKFLARILKSLVYFKRGVWWVGRSLGSVAGTFLDKVWHALAYIRYKLGFRLRKVGLGQKSSWLTTRLFFQLLGLGIFLIAAYPHTKLYNKFELGYDWQHIKLYTLTRQDAEIDQPLDTIEIVEGSQVNPEVTPSWRQEVFEAGTGEDVSPAHSDTIAVAVEGRALVKPLLIPDARARTRIAEEEYTIRVGDSIAQIAAEFGVTVETILVENNLTSRSAIRPGQVLKIPPVSGVMHVVAKGDTVKKIADLYKAPVSEIIAFNKLNSDGSGLVVGTRIMAHAGKTKEFLWTSNVDGTRNIRDAAIAHAVPKIIFTSSNCLWGKDMQRPVREDDEPSPVELYGQSKWEGEKILLERRDQIDTVIFRCPTIIDEGRLGLLAILFAFIDEGRRVWMVGGGRNRYQFIYGQDLASACMKTLDRDIAGVFNIGSDDVPTIRETYASMIARAGTGARVASLPCWVAIPLMKLAYILGLSPLGPYHYKMIAENFLFDTTKIKSSLDWKPTATNKDMLWKAYEYYHAHRDMLEKRTHVSAHKQPAKMGIIRLLKWLS
jgi:nucleoside-diphosphate-sugar epimerase